MHSWLVCLVAGERVLGIASNPISLAISLASFEDPPPPSGQASGQGREQGPREAAPPTCEATPESGDMPAGGAREVKGPPPPPAASEAAPPGSGAPLPHTLSSNVIPQRLATLSAKRMVQDCSDGVPSFPAAWQLMSLTVATRV